MHTQEMKHSRVLSSKKQSLGKQSSRTPSSRLLALSAVAALTLVLAGCGTTTGERAASGAGVGAAVGAGAAAATGGSVTQGAVIGGGVGAATGAATDRDDISLD